jgi:methionyl-tRNA formyltransferase
MLPKVVWEMQKTCTFNLHASILPNYRGAAPIIQLLMAKRKQVLALFIDDKIDTGAIIPALN